LSIAWAVTEYLHDDPERRAKTLFATHFHELVDIGRERKRVRNYNIGIIERDDRLIFLHRILPGGTNRSYGIQVARLAGLPDPVVSRAKEILANLEKGELDEIGRARLAHHAAEDGNGRRGQLQLFAAAPPHSPMEDELRALDTNGLTPLQALQFLSELKARIERA
ncbi:MAG: DNA mismatch repair protein MutS, partial [Deltaproteobacteria bacterium]|nr:DNA mismatch repair protein MutS [Deltaproteobacteria bacterium]